MSESKSELKGKIAGSGNVPLYVFLSDNDDRDAARKFAMGKNLPADNVLEGDVATATEFLQTNTPPKVLIVEIGGPDVAADQLNALSEVVTPDTKVIVVGTLNEYSFYCWLMDLGLSSYLLRPLSVEALNTAWDKAIEAPSATATNQKTEGRVIGCVGTRGGVGSTSLAIYLAALLAESEKKKVALVDLDPQDGSISLLLDVEPSRGLREVLDKPDRIDSLFLEKVMQRTDQGFHVLSAEESYAEPIKYHPDAASILLSELQASYDLIILDLPRQVHSFTRHCMMRCEEIFLVTELTLQGLRDTLRLSDLLRDGLKVKSLNVVASRSGMAPKYEMTATDFNKGMNGKLAYQLPFAPEVFMEIGSEMRALKKKNTAAMKILQKMVKQIDSTIEAVEDGENEDSAAKTSLPWFKRGKQG